GASNLEDFVKILKTDRPVHLHRAVAEAMTINETSFFRDLKPFEMLRETILPELIERRREERRLRIWSAASSTGQEAYSLAMLLVEHFPELAGWDVKIIGTDISRYVVEYARRARYRRLEVNRGLPARMLLKYMVRDGEEWEVGAQIRSVCEFQHVNLCEPLPLLPEFDLVVLRNVLLYFSQQDRRALFGEVYRKMRPDGYLVLGNAEQAEDSTNLFEVEFASNYYCYRPVAGA
ncbi:MAG TPA: protein-glutamate O-methyltransferase CheR, partial [Edaphobacter sp.]|nr:protein-glutamate O-methyltransferase CheR [Edaphobacter sp.]